MGRVIALRKDYTSAELRRLAAQMRNVAVIMLTAIAFALFVTSAFAQQAQQVSPKLLAYAGKTCSGHIGTIRNVDTFILRDGLLFVRHCFSGRGTQTTCEPDMQDRGEYLVETGKEGSGWLGHIHSAGEAEHYYSPSDEGPDRLKVKTEAQRNSMLGTYTCAPTSN
jgi:hypothetical protein